MKETQKRVKFKEREGIRTNVGGENQRKGEESEKNTPPTKKP
jgi:hypothetical protein